MLPMPSGLLSVYRPYISAAGKALYESITQEQQYARYLLRLYQIVQASVPLMQLAADIAYSRRVDGGDALVNYLEKHIDEERGHDEWLLEDLQKLRAAQMTTKSCAPDYVINLVGHQYFLVRFCSPYCILGYLLAIEGNPPSRKNIEELLPSLSGDATRTLVHHTNVDGGHLSDCLALVNSLALNDADLGWILRSISRTSIDSIRFAKGIIEENGIDTMRAL